MINNDGVIDHNNKKHTLLDPMINNACVVDYSKKHSMLTTHLQTTLSLVLIDNTVQTEKDKFRNKICIINHTKKKPTLPLRPRQTSIKHTPGPKSKSNTA